jgi:hypothetical protein
MSKVPLASVRPVAKSRPRTKAREQAQKERAQKRKQLLKVFDDMLLRYDVLAQRVSLTGMSSQGTHAGRIDTTPERAGAGTRQAAAKPRAALPPRKARPRLRKP